MEQAQKRSMVKAHGAFFTVSELVQVLWAWVCGEGDLISLLYAWREVVTGEVAVD